LFWIIFNRLQTSSPVILIYTVRETYLTNGIRKGNFGQFKKWRTRQTAASLTWRLVLNDTVWHQMSQEQCIFLLWVNYCSKMQFDIVKSLSRTTLVYKCPKVHFCMTSVILLFFCFTAHFLFLSYWWIVQITYIICTCI
jgi:hypothetical protein